MIVAEIEANNVKVKELAGEGDKWRDSFRKRYEAEMIERFDTHFFVGTLNQYPSSWIIVGLFYPPKRTIRDLFERLAGYRAYPRDYDVAKDSSVRATITATALKLDVRVLLKQNKAWDLQNFPNLPTDAASRRVCFLVFWRKTSSTWLPQVPVVIMISTGDGDRGHTPRPLSPQSFAKR